MSPLSPCPAQLYIGSPSAAHKQAQKHMQESLCTQKGCNVCSTCTLIAQQQHPACLWFNPEGNYTLETLKPFFSIISRTLDPEQKFFFIFSNADYLSNACTNSLLKSIEEPPPGYCILFLAQNFYAVAPTLRSRCIITVLGPSEQAIKKDDIVSFFTQKNADPEAFLQFLDKAVLDERTTHGALEHILLYWLDDYKNRVYSSNAAQEASAALAIVKEAVEKPPMPGSAKIFWKNLFLKMK